MFRWCSYCQRFMGESDPRDDFRLTHGVCRKCKSTIHDFNESKLKDILPIKEFFSKIELGFLQNLEFDQQLVLAEAIHLGINPSDLLAGIMQPMLYEIGKLYSEGKIPVAQEHLFSLFVKRLIRDIRKEYTVMRENARQADVLLVCAPGNDHEFGIALIELELIRAGLVVEVICPGVSPEETIEVIRKVKPKVLGISVSMPEQLSEVRRLAELLDSLGDQRPFTVAGGYAIRKETPEIKGVNLFTAGMPDFIEWIAEKSRIC